MSRRSAVALLSLWLGACGSSTRNPERLCQPCASEAECGGAACFQDVSGGRFCGSSCESCPAGYSCQTVSDSTGRAVESCFPDTEACVTSANDLGAIVDDGSASSGDLGRTPPPAPGSVGPQGGTVDRLFFGFTGDTRPAQCGGAYPTTVINRIFDGMKQQGVQFALDQGDHMFNCSGGSSGFAAAKQQMAFYQAASARLGAPVFMTLGNHECLGYSLCNEQSYGTNPNYTAFLDALSPISPKPYYRIDIQTRSGLAVFLFVADNAWDSTQEAWLTTQLTDADRRARYTFVSKHHPEGNSDNAVFPHIYDLVRQHKYTLFLTGHSHLFKRQQNDPRALVIGCGGAPLAGGTFWGYATAEQRSDDHIEVRIYDQATGNVMSSFEVPPQ